MTQAVTEAKKGTGQEIAKTPPYAWVILIVVFLASCSVPINMFKVPPIGAGCSCRRSAWT